MAKSKMLAVCVAYSVRPTWEHDCSHCKFIAHIDGHDAYVCGESYTSSIILRFGNEGPEYKSLPAHCAPEHSLYSLVLLLEKIQDKYGMSRNKYYTRALKPSFRPIRPQHLQANYN